MNASVFSWIAETIFIFTIIISQQQLDLLMYLFNTFLSCFILAVLQILIWSQKAINGCVVLLNSCPVVLVVFCFCYICCLANEFPHWGLIKLSKSKNFDSAPIRLLNRLLNYISMCTCVCLNHTLRWNIIAVVNSVIILSTSPSLKYFLL